MTQVGLIPQPQPILLHDSGGKICGVTGYFSQDNPGSLHMERTRHMCRDYRQLDSFIAIDRSDSSFGGEFLVVGVDQVPPGYHADHLFRIIRVDNR